MSGASAELRAAVDTVVAEIRHRMRSRSRPLVVAVDGRSGSGKSTVAAMIAPEVGAAIVSTDDFFAADISDAGWDARTPAERASDAIDWRRIRTDALEPLRAGLPARWQAFDFGAGARPDGTFGMQGEPTLRSPRLVVIVDGAYSTRPELADLIDLTVLVEAPVALRRRRLAAREELRFLERWHARWDEAEEYYFGRVRPPATFDLIVTTG